EGHVRLQRTTPDHLASGHAAGQGAAYPPAGPGPAPGGRPARSEPCPPPHTGRRGPGLDGPATARPAPPPSRFPPPGGGGRQPGLPPAVPRRRRDHARSLHLPPLLVPGRRLPARRPLPVRVTRRGGPPAAAALLSGAGGGAAAAEAEAAAAELRTAITASLARVAANLGRVAMPAGPRRGLDAGMIGSLVACAPLGLLPPDDPWVAGTMDVI